MILCLTQNQTDGRGVARVLEPVVDDVAIEVELAGVLWLEFALLQVDDDEGAQAQVVEEQVDIEVFVAHVEPILPADEGKALPELEQEFLQVADECGFEFAFLERLGEGEKVKNVGVFVCLLDEVGLRRS